MRQLFDALFSDLEEGEFIEIRIKHHDKENAAPYLCESVDRAEKVIAKATGEYHVWFGVAPRYQASNKVRRLTAVWIDVDAKDFDGDIGRALSHATESVALTPSCLVESGNGYHAYWFLDEPTNPAAARKLLRALHEAAGVGPTHDVTRFLRVPGTFNPKYKPPQECKIAFIHPELRYHTSDLMNATMLDDAVLRRIVTGDFHDYPSRSERDWFVIRSMQIVGMTTEGITAVFETRPVGDKYRSEKDPKHYLTFSMDKASESLQGVTVAQREDEAELFEEHPDGLWFTAGKRAQRVASFVFRPELLLDAPDGQVFHGTMVCGDKSWTGVSLPRDAFNRINSLTRHLTRMDWQWLGTDSHLRQYQLYLLNQHERIGGTQTVGVHSLGRHGDVWVAPDRCITVNGHLSAGAAPYVYLDPGQVKPEVAYEEPGAEATELAELFGDLYPKINAPSVVMPALGWFAASTIKPLIEEAGYRMPNLSVWGTKGGGKTSLIQLLLKLLGVVAPKAVYCGTTHFVTTALLASTTSIPVHLGEFRLDLEPIRLRGLRSMMLMQYDSGKDARGRADQTVTDYPLTAPTILDGEDMFEDAAVRERMVSVNMSPEMIEVGSPAWRAYKELEGAPLNLLAVPLIRHTLTYDAAWAADAIAEQLDRSLKVLTGRMPDRVRNNIAVCLAGWQLFCNFMDTMDALFPVPNPAMFAGSVGDVIDIKTGRARTFVDDFVTDAINHAAEGGQAFGWKLDDEGILWIHLAPAMNWWRSMRARSHQPTLGTEAIKRQLRERDERRFPGPGQYVSDIKTTRIENRSVHAYGVRLTAALDAGLDIPDEFSTTEVTIRL